ncbi:MAG: 6-bladed beta-propeller [Proteobacteria bacterium]|nr:6-bladed beta-propeller [Pseudomonadota bacterium]
MRRWPILLLALALGLALLATCAPAGDELERQAALYESIVWPEPPQQARIRLVGVFGEPEELGIRQSFLGRLWGWIAGAEARNMVRPYAIAVNGARLAVADPGVGAVHLYDMAGGDYERIEWAGEQLLQSPVGVAFVGDALYVADSALGRIFVFDAEGELTRTIEGLDRPTGLAWDPRAGRLYVTDTLRHGIVVLDADGKRLFEFGGRGSGDGQFNFPSHLTLAGGRLYVNDTMNFRVQTFDMDGNFVSAFGSHGDGSGDFSQPKGVGVDGEGHIYVVDALFNRVQIFDEEGQLLLAFGGDGALPGEFWLPSGMYINENRIYVADSYNRRVQIFQFLGGT